MGFSMEVTDTDAIKKEIIEEVKPVPEEVAKLKKIAEDNVSEILTLDLGSLEKRKTILSSIEIFGMETMQTSAKKNSLLQVSVGNLSKMGGESRTVATSLIDLQREIKDLDPSMIDFAKTGILSKLFNPLRAYFQKYQKADSVINDIVISLDKGKQH